MEFLLTLLSPLLNQGARYGLEQIFKRDVRFQVELHAYDKAMHSFEGRRVYRVGVKRRVSGPFDIKVHTAADGSGDGLIFFPGDLAFYTPPVIGFYHMPDVNNARRGSIVIDDVSTTGACTLYVATERPSTIAYVDLRYTVLNERQSERSSLLKLTLQGNS